MHRLADQKTFNKVDKRATCGVGVEVDLGSRNDEVYHFGEVLTVYKLKVQAIRKNVEQGGVEEMCFDCIDKVSKSFIEGLCVVCEFLEQVVMSIYEFDSLVKGDLGMVEK